MFTKEDLKSIRLIAFDFDGVFTDNKVFTNQDGSESVSCWRSDGIGISRITNLGIIVVIVSTETNPVVNMRALKLKIPCFQSIDDKGAAIIDICNKFNVSIENTMFVGNDINDIPAFKIVGFPVGVLDSYDEINSYIKYKTSKPGGYGAVREIGDLMFNAIKN